MIIDGDRLDVYNAPIALRKLGGSTAINLAAEIAARVAGDAANAAAIAAEALARSSADTTLQTNINNEALARANADTNLQNQINALTSTYATPLMLGGM